MSPAKLQTNVRKDSIGLTSILTPELAVTGYLLARNRSIDCDCWLRRIGEDGNMKWLRVAILMCVLIVPCSQASATHVQAGFCTEVKGGVFSGNSTAGYDLGIANQIHTTSLGEFLWLASTCLARSSRDSEELYQGANKDQLTDLFAEGSSYHLGGQFRTESGFGVKLKLSVAQEEFVGREPENQDQNSSGSGYVERRGGGGRDLLGVHSLLTYDTAGDSLLNFYVNIGRIDSFYDLRTKSASKLAQTQFSFGLMLDLDR